MLWVNNMIALHYRVYGVMHCGPARRKRETGWCNFHDALLVD